MNVEMVGVHVSNRRSAIPDLAVLDGHGLAAFDGVHQGPHGIPATTVVARRPLVGHDEIGCGVGAREQLGGQGGADLFQGRDGCLVEEGAGQPGQRSRPVVRASVSAKLSVTESRRLGPSTRRHRRRLPSRS